MEGWSPETWAVIAGRPDTPGEPLNTPLELASTYRAGDAPAAYSREAGTATWRALEDAIGALEGGRAVSFASGMAAAAALLDALPQGGRLVLPAACYQGVASLAAEGAAQRGWQVTRLPVRDTEAWIAAAADADLLWLESPTNPLLDLADVQAICAGAGETPVVVDNTFATPLLQRPLALGARYVLHSATKFLGGHSDLLLGAVVVADPEAEAALRRRRTLSGATPGGLEAFLALRGIRTLPLRVDRAQTSALALASALAGHARVERVRYPGLPSDPNHALARASWPGFGAVLSFEVRGGAAAADEVVARLRLIHPATSLGGVESTIERRGALAGQEHVPPGLLRLSVGCEALADLEADLRQALG